MFLWCQPLSYNWTVVAWFRPYDKDNRCPALFTPTVFITLSLTNLITDLFILGVPLSILTTMQFRRIEKVGLVVVFLVGAVSIGATVARLGVLAPKIRKGEMGWESEHTYAMLSHAEVAMGVMALCLPSFGGAMRRCVERKWWQKKEEKKGWVKAGGVGGFGYRGSGGRRFTGDSQGRGELIGRPLVRAKESNGTDGSVSLYESFPGWEAPRAELRNSTVEMGEVRKVRELV